MRHRWLYLPAGNYLGILCELREASHPRQHSELDGSDGVTLTTEARLGELHTSCAEQIALLIRWHER